MADSPQTPRRRRRGYRFALVLVLTSVAYLSGCGAVTGWYLGWFTSNGRFAKLDACTLMPPGALAQLLSHAAREPGSSQPAEVSGNSTGTLGSQCRWSSVPEGDDDPFRTVRIYAETTVHDGRTPAEAEAKAELASWRQWDSRQAGVQLGNMAASGMRVQPVRLGEESYTVIDEAEINFLLSDITVYDVHAKFRISNAVLDVSARTHAKPDQQTAALMYGLAGNIAQRLAHTG